MAERSYRAAGGVREKLKNLNLCKVASLGTRPNLFSFLFQPFPYNLLGETELVMPASGSLRADYAVMTAVNVGAVPEGDSAIVYNVDEVDLSYRVTYNLTCDPASSTWQWTRSSDENESIPHCAGISRVCNTAPALVSAADGTTLNMSEWYTCDDSTFRGQRPSAINVEPTNAPGNELVGLSCTPGQTFEEAFPRPADRVEYDFGQYILGYRVDCMPPEDLVDPIWSTGCSDLSAGIATEAVTYGEGAPDDMIYEICSLETSCGDGFCEPYCEINENCSQDCASVSIEPQVEQICDVQNTCGDGVCLESCENADNCAEDCAVTTIETVCGDGVISGEEQCEESSQCQSGFFCGDPSSNAACSCVSLTTLDKPDPGAWGACGSCDSCGFNVNQCVVDPSGACVWDPTGCGAASCGDGACNGSENANTCPADCP